MSSSPQNKRLMAASAFLIAALAVAGGVYYLALFESSAVKTAGAPPSRQNQAPPSAAGVPRPLLSGNTASGASGPSDPVPSLTPPPVNGLRVPALPFPDIPGQAASPFAASGQEAPPPRETRTDPPLSPSGREEPAPPPSSAPAPGQEEHPGLPRSGGQEEETALAQAPLILYGKGTAVGPEGNVVRGEIPPHQTPPDTTELYGSPPEPGKEGGRRVPPRGEDSIVTLASVRELAKFLADNYWPAGTHPQARARGITTATVKWANVKFGGQLQGFSVNHANARQERTRVLDYMFMPSMINGLYNLYSTRFLTALEREALSQKRGQADRPLSKTELAEMYELYGTMARGLAGTVRAYSGTPGMRSLVKAYADADEKAENANRRFLAAIHDKSPDRASLAKQYQAAVLQREHQREKLAASLRRNGSTGLDDETLIYTALWLYRRADGSRTAGPALADILDKCANSLEQQRRNAMSGETPRTRQ